MSTLRRLWLQAIPKTLLSRTTGFLTDLPLPRWARARVYGWFSRRYGVNLDEMAGSLTDYESLSAFFTRQLVPGARPIADAPIVWPCDGRIVTSGPITDGRVEQIKGQTYDVEHLLLDGPLAARLRNATQATIYLAPGDYHRVHVPFDGQRLRQWHVSGGLYPVNRETAQAVPELFVRNERVVYELRLVDGRAAAVVMVAALNVGNIKPAFPISGEVRRGDELGVFHLGSTVIVLVEAGQPCLLTVSSGALVRMGQRAS
ncbi:MAG: archaetidylserine decarboxylase [Planctomycetota bacterium]